MNPEQSTMREVRYLAEPIEIRAAADAEESKTVRGYAAKFNKESNNLGTEQRQFIEVIERGAFDNVLNDDVRALLNHDPNLVLARSKNGQGTLRMGTDDEGLWYEFEAPDTQVGRDLLESLKRGDIDQSSFAFEIDGEEWETREMEDGKSWHKRTIKSIKRLFDVSPVTYPAYPDATVALRSLEQALEQAPAEEREEEKPDLTLNLHWQRRLDLIDKTATKQTNEQ